MRLGCGPGSADDVETLFHQQTTHFLSEAHVVVDDQAAQGHVGATIAELVTAGVPADPRLCHP